MEPTMPFKLSVYNVEHFNNWFEADNSIKTTAGVTKKVNAFGTIISAIDADFIGIVEAPNTTHGGKSTVACLEALATRLGLRQSKAAMGFTSRGSQEIAALFDPAKASVRHAPGGRASSKTNPPFDHEFQADSDLDDIKEIYRHYRPPFEAEVTRTDTGAKLRVIVAHLKSKGIFDNVDFVHWQRESQRNRRKLFAEAGHLRARVDEFLDDGRDVVVMGDINDGPGMDDHEKLFGRSAVEIVMGDLFTPDRILRALSGRPVWGRFGWKPASARFRDQFTRDPVNVLIDHIFVSAQLKAAGVAAHEIWNPYEFGPAEPLTTELLEVSDHFPVALTLA
jgi:endonuclease/exonuclease/phosphatase family metal-dependent hydrolase